MSNNKLILSIVMLLFLWCCPACADEPGIRPRLGCIPFMATSLQAMAFTEDISSLLLNSIDRSRYFEIIERKKIEHYLELEGLRLDNIDQESILKVSAKAGLDYVVYGSVSVNENGTTLDIILLNVRSRKVPMKESFNMSQTDFSKKLLELAGIIVNRVQSAAYQAQIKTPDVVLVKLPVKPPQGLEATGTANCIRLRWHSDSKQIAGFKIYRSNTSDGQYSPHATTAEPYFTDENMKLNEVYYYRVAAVCQDGSISEFTPPVRGGTSIAPPPPIFMNIEPDIKGARLVWRPRTGAGGDPRIVPQGFRVYRRQGVDGEFKLIARLPVNALTYADNDLNDGVKYVYTIASHNSDGTESEYSAQLSVVPFPTPNAIRTTSGKIRQVPLSWDRYGSKEIDGYKIFRSDSKEGNYTLIAKLDDADATNFVDHGRTDNATYWYRISVFKKGGADTALSEPVSAVTRNIPPLPLNLTAISGQPRKATLRWQLAGTAADEIKSVVIYRMMEEKDVNLEKVGEISADQAVFVDDKQPLKDNTSYYYRICAKNSGGAVSMQTGTVSATTKAPPEAPANVSASSGEVKKTVLTWDKNRETDIEEYHVFMKRPGDADFRHIRKLTGNSSIESDLLDGTEYSFIIRAVDKDELVSGFSKTVVVRTKPLPSRVTGLTAAEPMGRTVTWQPNKEKDVHTYTIYKKGFMGISQKLATVRDTKWQVDEVKDSLELYVTALDDTGLESEPSDIFVFKKP